jgi:hypothetical protein
MSLELLGLKFSNFGINVHDVWVVKSEKEVGKAGVRCGEFENITAGKQAYSAQQQVASRCSKIEILKHTPFQCFEREFSAVRATFLEISSH